MITVDDATGALSLSLDDLVDAGDGGRAPATVEPSHARLESQARARFAHAELARGARVDVEVATELDWRARVVTIRGRVACVRAGKRGATVLELAFAPSTDPDTDLRRARERAGFAALVLALCGEKVARFGVANAPLLEGAVRAASERFAPDVLATLLDERLLRLQRVWLGESAPSARPEPPFPFGEPRPAQSELMRAVADAAEGGLILLASAPTGIGKTAAALHPLLVRAVRERSRVTFTTSRVSQQALALETLGRMLPPGGPSYAVQISSQERICPRSELGCGLRPCPWRKRFAERLLASGILPELAARGVVESPAIAAAASAHDLCPFETSLALATDAVALVADLNYVFDPRVYLRRVLDAEPEREYLVVDEAHDLLERVRESLSAELEPARMSALAEREALRGAVRARGAAVLAELAETCARELARIAEERADDAPWVEPLPRDFFEPFALRAAEADVALAIQAARAAAPEAGDSRGRDPLRATLQSVGELARAASGDPERFAALWSPDKLRVLALDPAPWIGSRLRAFRSATLISATLTPLDFHAETLGVAGPRCVSLELDSPFPRANRVILLVDSVDTRLRERSANAAPIADAILRAVQTRPGNWLAFFPSFAFRDEVIGALPRRALRVLLQMPGMPVEPLLRKLREPRAGATLLAGVHGGSLAEGVDYPGDLAIGVFVVGPGLPRADRERELVRGFYERERGDGFDLAYVFPGLARSAQAGGRVLRSPDDVGAIVLFDRRFAEPSYRTRLPRWWRDELEVVADPVPALEAFWRRVGARARGLPSSAT